MCRLLILVVLFGCVSPVLASDVTFEEVESFVTSGVKGTRAYFQENRSRERRLTAPYMPNSDYYFVEFKRRKGFQFGKVRFGLIGSMRGSLPKYGLRYRDDNPRSLTGSALKLRKGPAGFEGDYDSVGVPAAIVISSGMTHYHRQGVQAAGAYLSLGLTRHPTTGRLVAYVPKGTEDQELPKDVFDESYSFRRLGGIQ